MEATARIARAVIFVPCARHRHRWERVCAQDCAARGDEVVAVVIGAWQAAMTMVVEGAADVIVVARQDHIPPGALPWVRVVGAD